MLNRNVCTFLSVAAFPAFFTFTGTAPAAPSDGTTMASSGVVRCGGNSYVRNGSGEIHWTSYNLKNFNSDRAIAIQRLRVFDVNGATLFDSRDTGLPVPDNGTLVGPNNNKVAPNATVGFFSHTFLGLLDPALRPIQMEVRWKAAVPALTLNVSANRIARAYDPMSQVQGEERARSAAGCRTISLQ